MVKKNPMMMARSCNPGVGMERRDTMNPSLWTPTYIKKKLLSSPSCGTMKKTFSVTHPDKKPETRCKEHPGESGFSAAARQEERFAPANFSLPFVGARQLPAGNHPNGLPLGSAAFRPLPTQGPALYIQRFILHMGPNLCKRKIAKKKIFGRDISCSILLSRRLEL